MKTFGIVISLSFSLSETKKKVYFKVDFFKSFSVLREKVIVLSREHPLLVM